MILTKQSFDYVCPDGHKGSTDVMNFRAGKRCRKCWGNNNRGEKHYNWNSELTEKDRLKRRHFPETREWRNSVFEKDKYTCQICKQLGGSLIAHHLDGWDKHPQLRFELANGVTLCRKYHKEFHISYGNGKNTKSQYESWFKLHTKNAPDNHASQCE